MNQITIKKWCPSYCFGLQIISTVFSLWSCWILFLLLVFLLYVWGDVVSSRCCCWVVWRYNGIPYIDSCPVPVRHGCVLVVMARPGFPEMIYKSAMKKRAGQPALASSSAPWPRTDAPTKPKMVSTSSSSPICGLRPRTRGRSMISPRLASPSSFAGGGVGTRRGRGGVA